MFPRRSHGHAVGWVSLACGAVTATKFGVFGDNYVAAILGGAAFAGYGVYMLTKLYLDDPEARLEYQNEILSRLFSAAVSRFSVDDMLRLFAPEEVLRHFEKEFGSGGHNALPRTSISKVLAAIPLRVVFELQDRLVLPLADLQARFALDVAQFERTQSFTSLWLAMNGTLPELLTRHVADAASCRRLLELEFDWVVPEDGRLRPTGSVPSALQAAPGAPVGLLKAAIQYGLFTINALGCTTAFWKTVIRTSPYGETSTFDVLYADGLIVAFDSGFVDQAWVQQKFDAMMLRQHETTSVAYGLWDLDTKFDMKALLSKRVITAASVEEQFHKALPLNHAVLSSLTSLQTSKRANVIDFLEYWETTLREHPNLVPPHLKNLLIQTYNDYASQKVALSNDITRKRQAAQHRISEWRKEKTQLMQANSAAASTGAPNHHHHAVVNSDLSKRLAILDSKIRDEELWIADSDVAFGHELDALKRRMHEQFSVDASTRALLQATAHQLQLSCAQQ